MSDVPLREPLVLPAALEAQLDDFRRRVWTIKTIEALGGALFGIVLSYLTLFVLDRFIDTPVWGRLTIFFAASAASATAPLLLHRWVWGHRRTEQLARLIGRHSPNLGDQLLGIIELVRNESEQARSRTLCQAAITQVAGEAAKRDFSSAVPKPRHRHWAWTAGITSGLALLLLMAFPAAAFNALGRFLMPWRPIPRYTFAAVEKLPEQLVVAQGEPTQIPLELTESTQWRPAAGTMRIGTQPPITATREDQRYNFEVPGQIQPQSMTVTVGDATQSVQVKPLPRPELAAIAAEIRLPDYLQRTNSVHKDVRGGMLTAVKGSTAAIEATANRELQSATVDGQPVTVRQDHITTTPIAVDAPKKVRVEWRDGHGLAGREPFAISIVARDDEAPTVACDGLPRQKILLDSESLTFKVHAQDDFGVRTVGFTWKGARDTNAQVQSATPAQGEQLLAAGGADRESLALTGTFCAKTLGIEPQTLELRLFVEDYFPGRPRVYSAPYYLHVLSPEQHAIWLTEQLAKWHRLSLEVRDRELQLHATNQELRMLSEEELDQPETRRRLDQQSAAERANGRRLNSLVNLGEELVRQAMRNPEFAVGHIEKWAEMLQVLKDISGSRMPSVAELLKQSAQAAKSQSPSSAPSSPGEQKPPAPQAGQAQPAPNGPPANSPPPLATPPKPPVPSIVTNESQQQPARNDPPNQTESPPSPPSSPKFGLPQTTLNSLAPPKQGAPKSAAAQKLDEAVKVQEDLLAEFEKIAEELNKVLANLEGSTLVKRLKAASRQQYIVATKLGRQVNDAFGQADSAPGDAKAELKSLSAIEAKASLNVSNIMDDMQAYFERRRFQRFKTVLDEMRAQDAIGGIRQLGDDLTVESGLSVSQAEFWSDSLDRWAENLVDPACSGQCQCKSKASLPPSIVLEALRILEAEMNLREDTRVAEQAKPAMETVAFSERANGLSKIQEELADRTSKLVERIRDLPDGEENFGPEINLISAVAKVMVEAQSILARPETGSPAIAAETEAIELLLKSKRINPKSRGGGGGSSPGGGGGGTTIDAALALIGSGVNDQEVREDRGIAQSTGETAPQLPEEFRAGLDEYFNQLERKDQP